MEAWAREPASTATKRRNDEVASKNIADINMIDGWSFFFFFLIGLMDGVF